MGPKLVQITLEKVPIIHERLKAAQDKQNNRADSKRRPLEFSCGEVYLKVSLLKGVMRFGKSGKLSPKFIRPYKVLDKVGHLAYRLAYLRLYLSFS